MPIRPAEECELGEVILTRTCTIEAPDGEVSPLVLSFMRAKPSEGGDVEGSLRFQCEHFDVVETLIGGDDVQVLTFLLHIGRIRLGLWEEDGYSIWWNEKGDLQFFDFWSYQRKPSEFCLQSAFNDAASEAFAKATEGKFLMPSHRVAVELDRPGITTYAVQTDGSDRVDGLIGAADLKGISPDELCRRLGRMILNGSSEGRELLAGLPA